MNATIKKRIEDIKKGIVPEGYKKTKAGVIPREWEIVRLSDISVYCKKKNNKMEISETATNSAIYGVVKQVDFFDKEISNKENIANYYIVKKNDYVYNPRISNYAPCGPINKSYFDNSVIVSPLYTVFKLNKGLYENKYIESYFKSSCWYAYIKGVANFGARHDRMNLTNEDFFAMPILFPPLAEQQKIAEILETQDKLIKLQERLIEEYKKLKKYFLSKMFPKKGCNYPEIRFPEFTAPWEQRKVYEVAERYDNLRVPVPANLRVRGNIPYYGANGIQDYVDGFTHDGEFALVAEDGANDLKNYPVQRVNGRIWVNNHAHVLQGKPDLMDSLFFAYSLHRANIASFLVGGSRAKLNADTLMTLELLLPGVEEQTKIGRLLDGIDNLITLHQRKLDEMKIYKKALMQLLLTGIVRVNSD